MNRMFRGLKYLYPYGATLNVVQPSAVTLSSGAVAIPTNRPICAYYSSKSNAGKLVVLGSSRMLTDSYIEKEKNDQFREMLFEFFDSNEVSATDGPQLDDIDVSSVMND